MCTHKNQCPSKWLNNTGTRYINEREKTESERKKKEWSSKIERDKEMEVDITHIHCKHPDMLTQTRTPRTTMK